MDAASLQPFSRYRYRGAITQAKERRLRRLDDQFLKIFAKVQADPADAVRETCAVLRRNLRAFIQAEGIAIPKSKGLFELWNAARSAFGEPSRFGPEFSIEGRLESLLMAIESLVVGELGALPNNGFYIEGIGEPTYIGFPEARLIVLLGHIACSFIIAVRSANDDDRLLRIHRVYSAVSAAAIRSPIPGSNGPTQTPGLTDADIPF